MATLKSTGPAAIMFASGPAGMVTVELGNPNATSVTGTIHKRIGPDAHFITKVTVDGYVKATLFLAPLARDEAYTLTLDAAPSAQLTIDVW